MFRNTGPVVSYILDKAFGLPGIIVFGLLAGTVFGAAVGRMSVPDILLAETALWANSLTVPVHVPVSSTDRATHCPGLHR
jgi:hypothetical protein